MGLQTPSAPPVLFLTPLLGSLSSDSWLQAFTSVLVRFGRASHGTTIPSSSQQAIVGISNSVWWLHVGWIPRCGSLWMVIPSVSASLFVPVFSLDKNNSGLTFLRLVGGHIPKPRVVPKLWIWSLQVLSPLLGISLLGPVSLLFTWHVGLWGG